MLNLKAESPGVKNRLRQQTLGALLLIHISLQKLPGELRNLKLTGLQQKPKPKLPDLPHSRPSRGLKMQSKFRQVCGKHFH